MPGKRRIIPIETDPSVIKELCQYDQGIENGLSERAMRALGMITVPKNPDDDTATALGYIGPMPDQHASRGLPDEQITFTDYLVSSSREYRVSLMMRLRYPTMRLPEDGVLRPDGVYTLIPAEQSQQDAAQKLPMAV